MGLRYKNVTLQETKKKNMSNFQEHLRRVVVDWITGMEASRYLVKSMDSIFI